MATVEKLSVTLSKEDVEWARKRAKERGLSLSALLSSTVREARQHEARREYLEWAMEGEPPFTAEEIAQAERELYGAPAPPVEADKPSSMPAAKRAAG